MDVQLSALKAHPQNYNQHSEDQIKRLVASLERFGQAKEIVVYDGMIVAGHGLVEAARRLGWTTLRASDRTHDWTAEEALAYLAADNELARLADPDEAALAQLAASLRDVDAELAALAAGTEERLAELLRNLRNSEELGDPGPQVDKASELQAKWGTATGQLWQLGEHRLICGDCTDAAVVARVMGEEKADLVVTDPPYGVDYAAKNRALQTIGPSNRLTTDIQGDTLSTEDAATLLWGPAFSNAFDAARNGAVVYCFAPQGGDQMMMMMMLRAKWNDRLHQLIWRKNAPTFSMGRLDYSYQHEPILYSWRGANHKFYGQNARSIIDCDRPSASKLHPTMKPVELIEILLRNSSQPGEIVLDPFSGSGTTLIACERLGRRCRAVEIDPGYVAVALERWATMTGRTPVLVEPAAAAHDAPGDDEDGDGDEER